MCWTKDPPKPKEKGAAKKQAKPPAEPAEPAGAAPEANAAANGSEAK